MVSSWGDNLLYAISAKQEMAWLTFKEILDQLCALQLSEGDLMEWKWKRSQTVRILDSLGHCDIDFSLNGGRVDPAPAALVRLPWSGLPRAVLTGRRSPKLLSELTKICQKYNNIELDVTQQQQTQGFAPSRIALQAESTEELVEVTDLLKIPFIFEPPAWTILQFSASLEEYLATCEWINSDELKLKRKFFDTSCLQFRYDFQPKHAESFYLGRYSHPTRNVPMYFLWKNGQRSRVENSWGIYAIFQALKLNILLYDKSRYLMAIPSGAPLPRLLERALVLCSGYAATFISRDEIPCEHPENRGFNLFRDVPPLIAEILSKKLGQSLVHFELEVNLQALYHA